MATEVADSAPIGTNGASSVPASSPRFRREGLGYSYELAAADIQLHADYLREQRDEFSAEITVENLSHATPPHLYQARLNISSGPARSTLARHLGALTPTIASQQWDRIIEQFCVSIIRQERVGEPLMRVGNLNGLAKTGDQIERLLPAGKPTIWYGQQGSSKGWMATIAAVCTQTGISLAGLRVRQGNVLYLDWEDNAHTLNDRVRAISAGLGLEEAPEIAYRQCRRTLPRDLHIISRHVSDLSISLVIVDSVGLAAGSLGDRGSYEDVALGLFDALRHLAPATVLLIDHVVGASIGDPKLTGKPIGSIYKLAEARAAWEVRADEDEIPGEVSLGFFHTKHNHSLKYRPMGFRLVFGDSEPGAAPSYVRVQRNDVRDSFVLTQSLSVADQIAALLRHGATSTKALAEQLSSIGEPVIRSTLSRGKGTRFVQRQDGTWGLLETQQ